MILYDGMSVGFKKKLNQWMPKYWGHPYVANPLDPDWFVCTTPWLRFAKDMYNIPLKVNDTVDSWGLANRWLNAGSMQPPATGDFALFAFQASPLEVNPLRPQGVVHIELVVASSLPEDSVTVEDSMGEGLMLGIGAASDFNFTIHPFAPGLAGDHWYDPLADQWSIMYRYISFDYLRVLSSIG